MLICSLYVAVYLIILTYKKKNKMTDVYNIRIKKNCYFMHLTSSFFFCVCIYIYIYIYIYITMLVVTISHTIIRNYNLYTHTYKELYTILMFFSLNIYIYIYTHTHTQYVQQKYLLYFKLTCIWCN